MNQMLVHTFQYRQTPLHLAVEGNNRDFVELLLQAGADVNEMDGVNGLHKHAITFTATGNEWKNPSR